MSNLEQAVLLVESVTKSFTEGSGQLDVIRGIDLRVKAGETLSIVGSSGSGKTTLLQLLGGLDVPTKGRVSVMGQCVSQLSQAARGELRNRHIGFVYQFHHLLPEFTALENVCMPLLIRGEHVATARQEAKDLLERVGLSEREHHKPAKLSGGERQRVAIARALVTKPQLVLADEPTGNLDGENAEKIQSLLMELNRELNTSIILVTHDLGFAEMASKVYLMEQGHLRLRSASIAE